MAQEKKARSRRLGLLAARYGLKSKRGVTIACALLVVALGVTGLIRATAGNAVVVERSNDVIERRDETQEKPSDETSGSSSAKRDAKKEEAVPQEIWVHVDGAVGAPGVYALSAGNPRVKDAIDLAGGLAADASTSTINLAEPLSDGQKIHVPREGETPAATPQEVGPPSGNANEGPAQVGSGLININTATEAELQDLPGVGEATATSIVEERSSGGPFSSPEDIMRVSGIGEKKFEKMKEHICV